MFLYLCVCLPVKGVIHTLTMMMGAHKHKEHSVFIIFDVHVHSMFYYFKDINADVVALIVVKGCAEACGLLKKNTNTTA